MNTTRLGWQVCIVLVLALAIGFVACSKKEESAQQQGQQQAQQQTTTTTTTSAPSDVVKKYPFKSAIVEMKYGGDCTGTQVIYIDDYGMKEARVENFKMKMMRMEVPTNKIDLTIGDWLYNIDMEKKEGTKMKNPFMDMMKSMSEEQKKDLVKMGEDMMRQMGAKEAGEETIAGKPCKVWTMESLGTKVWTWSGLTLKSRADLMGVKQHLEATNVQIDVPVPADKFEVPAGVKVTETSMEQMMQQSEKETGKEKSGGQ
jgi:hypothetical protein